MNEFERSAYDSMVFWVWSGFYDPDEVQEMIADELSDIEIVAPDFARDVDESKLRAAAAAEFEKKRAAETSWPAVTDCDRLDTAFAELSDAGIIALHNAGTTVADGISDVAEVLDSIGRDGIHGYCFYHSQDIERAIAGRGLWIAFGDLNEDRRESAAVATTIQGVLEQHGFAVEWNGDAGTRLDIPVFDWKRRLMDLPED